MDNFYDLDMLFIILTGKVSMMVNRVLSRNFKAANIDVTPEQFTVMAYLWKKEGISQQELCDEMSKGKTSMTRILDNLEKQNLVVRIPDKSDRRNNLIYLTKAGKDLKNSAMETTLETMKLALQRISPEHLDTCKYVLKNVLENIK